MQRVSTYNGRRVSVNIDSDGRRGTDNEDCRDRGSAIRGDRGIRQSVMTHGKSGDSGTQDEIAGGLDGKLTIDWAFGAVEDWDKAGFRSVLADFVSSHEISFKAKCRASVVVEGIDG